MPGPTESQRELLIRNRRNPDAKEFQGLSSSQIAARMEGEDMRRREGAARQKRLDAISDNNFHVGGRVSTRIGPREYTRAIRRITQHGYVYLEGLEKRLNPSGLTPCE